MMVGVVQKDWVWRFGFFIIWSMKRAAYQPISYISTSIAVRVGWTIMEKG